MGEGIVVRWAYGSFFLQLVAIIHFIISMMKFVKLLPNFSTNTYVLISIIKKKQALQLEDLVEKSENTDSKGICFKNTYNCIPREGNPATTHPCGAVMVLLPACFVQRLPLRHHLSLDVIILRALFILKNAFNTKPDFVDIFPCQYICTGRPRFTAFCFIVPHRC